MHAHALPLMFAIVAGLCHGMGRRWLVLAQGEPTPAAAACDRCGKVESIREVANKDQWTPLGSSVPRSSDLGATGVAAYQIGPGFSNQGQVMIGAAGGGAYQTRAKQRNNSRWEIVVKMDNGSARSIVQNYEPLLVIGRSRTGYRNANRTGAVTALASNLAAGGPAATLAVSDAADGTRVLLLAGRLDAYSIAGVWATGPRRRWRGAPIGASSSMHRASTTAMAAAWRCWSTSCVRSDRRRHRCAVHGLRPEFQTLLDQFDPVAMRAPAAEPEERSACGRGARPRRADYLARHRDAGCFRRRDQFGAVVRDLQSAQRALEGRLVHVRAGWRERAAHRRADLVSARRHPRVPVGGADAAVRRRTCSSLIWSACRYCASWAR